MGTDIHLMLEVRRGGKWELATDALIPNHWYRKDAKYEWETQEMIPLSEGGPRNYDAFAILGDVRNGHGFAGIKTGDGFAPLSSGRGLPDDLSQIVDPDAVNWGHSHSYLTLRELVADDNYWNQSSGHCGYVAARVYANWDKQGEPPSYCGDVSGQGIKKVSGEEMDSILAALDEKPAPPDDIFEDNPLPGHEVSHFVFVEWGESYKDAAGYYYRQLIPALAQYAEERKLSHDDVRLVFFFDS